MINIVSVRIRNFRALSEVYFRPKTRGITGIAGANGKGKSSILYATMFALYGTLPPGTTKSSLRRIGSDGQECSVSVVFTHLGQTVEVIRELRKTNNATVVNIYVDGVPQTVTTTSSADRWISERLGIDEQGFLTSFVVRQKELDTLVTAKPAERKAQIEKLAGIETIKAAVSLSRKDEEAAKKVLATLPGSQEAVNEADNNLTLLTERIQQVENQLSTAAGRQNSLNTDLRAARKELDEKTSQHSSYLQAQTAYDATQREITSLEEQAATLSYLEDLEGYGDLQALRDEYKSLSEQIEGLTRSEITERQRMEGVAAEKAALQQTISEHVARQQALLEEINAAKAAEEWLADTVEGLNAVMDAASHAALGHSQRNNVLTSQAGTLTESLTQLQHTSECPTCHTTLEGEAGRVLLDNLTSMRDNALAEADNEKVLYDAEMAKQEKAAAQLALLVEDSQLEAQIKSITDRLGELDAATSEVDLEDLAQQRKALEERKNEVADLGAKASNADKDKKLVSSIRQKLEDAQTRIGEYRKLLDNTTGTVITADDLTIVRNKVDTLEAQYDGNSVTLEHARSELNTVQAKFSQAQTTYRISVEQWDKKKSLFAEQERLALTTDMLDKFRSDRIAALAPEISDYATSLISDITNGDFVEVLIDENFNTSIVDAEGIERPVEWLSGGELSAVAFAIRISIGFIITGGNPEFLWLDEPLTAQDTDRRAAMLSTIRRLPIDQIVIINHASEAADIVDETVTLVGSKKEGTRLVTENEAEGDEQG